MANNWLVVDRTSAKSPAAELMIEVAITNTLTLTLTLIPTLTLTPILTLALLLSPGGYDQDDRQPKDSRHRLL